MKQAYENTLADESITDKKRNATEQRMITVLKDIKTLKPKMHEPRTDI